MPLTAEQRAWLGKYQPLPEPDPVATLSVKYREALQGMRDVEFLNSHKHQEQHWRADRAGAHPAIVGMTGITGFEKLLIRRMAKLGVPMFASEVVRSGKRQNELKAQGHSKAGWGESPHQYGCAVDIIHARRGWDLSRQQWAVVGHVGKEIVLEHGWKVEWGGDWKFWDPAHWEVVGWRDIKRELDDSDLDGTFLSAEQLVTHQLFQKRGQ